MGQFGASDLAQPFRRGRFGVTTDEYGFLN